MHNSLYIHLSFTANEGDRRGSEEDIRELGGGGAPQALPPDRHT